MNQQRGKLFTVMSRISSDERRSSRSDSRSGRFEHPDPVQLTAANSFFGAPARESCAAYKQRGLERKG